MGPTSPPPPQPPSMSSDHLDSSAAAAVLHHMSTSKRKLEDYTDDEGDLVQLYPTKIRKDQNTLTPYRHQFSSESTRLQFFVRTISLKTLVLHADRYDTVESVLEKIFLTTGLPVGDQRLIYRGKQLKIDETLAESLVVKDACLQLVARMRSTGHPQTWQLVDEMITHIISLCRSINEEDEVNLMITELTRPNHLCIKSQLTAFLNMTPRNGTDKASGHLEIFLASSAPTALVMLYISSVKDNRRVADEAIQHFISSSKSSLPRNIHILCTPIVLEFCKLLQRAVGREDPLYNFCRSSLGSMVQHMLIMGGRNSGGIASGNRTSLKGVIDVREIFNLVSELASKLSDDLLLSLMSNLRLGPAQNIVHDFVAFLFPLRNAIVMQAGFCGPIKLPLCKGRGRLSHGKEIEFLHVLFIDLLEKMDLCLSKMEELLSALEKGKSEQLILGCSQYLAILKELNSMSKLYEGGEELLWGKLRKRKVSFCHLIVKYAKRTDDFWWILDHKEAINFETRRHLAMMMLPDVKEDYDEVYEMLIDRSQLLAESFEYIARAEPDSLRSGLFMEFKNEEASGAGVLREWFFLVCQAIFNPQNALFVACTNDRGRFFPNPASKVDPLHLQYFSFSGRAIALALIHNVQVGVAFDRVFFVQLAGKKVVLEDIRDADPYLYSSCKQILEMDPDLVDQDALGLTFIHEVDELGFKKVVELCPNGRSISVTSENRKEYVDRLIQHIFVTSTAEQVARFARGFSDIIGSGTLQRSFFQSLYLEDLDWMLSGSEHAISVEDWKAHTKYNGYKDTDPQIRWFWKIVGKMSAEQKKVLLFFWTSIKCLPVEGFGGLESPLYIYKNHEPRENLPSSHTCFYRICFPAYRTMSVMQDRLRIITQEHVGSSFGTW